MNPTIAATVRAATDLVKDALDYMVDARDRLEPGQPDGNTSAHLAVALAVTHLRRAAEACDRATTQAGAST